MEGKEELWDGPSIGRKKLLRPTLMENDFSTVKANPLCVFKLMKFIYNCTFCFPVKNGTSSRPTAENYPVLSQSMLLSHAISHNSLNTEKKIELHLMRMIRWKSQSDEKELNLLEEMTGPWTTIGDLLDLNPAKLTAIKMGSTNPEDWIRDVVLEWKKKGSKKVRRLCSLGSY